MPLAQRASDVTTPLLETLFPHRSFAAAPLSEKEPLARAPASFARATMPVETKSLPFAAFEDVRTMCQVMEPDIDELVEMEPDIDELIEYAAFEDVCTRCQVIEPDIDESVKTAEKERRSEPAFIRPSIAPKRFPGPESICSSPIIRGTIVPSGGIRNLPRVVRLSRTWHKLGETPAFRARAAAQLINEYIHAGNFLEAKKLLDAMMQLDDTGLWRSQAALHLQNSLEEAELFGGAK